MGHLNFWAAGGHFNFIPAGMQHIVSEIGDASLQYPCQYCPRYRIRYPCLLLRHPYMSILIPISYPISRKKLRYRWSKTVGTKPLPNIVPISKFFASMSKSWLRYGGWQRRSNGSLYSISYQISKFFFDIEVLTLISKFIHFNIEKSSKNDCDIEVQKLRFRSLKYDVRYDIGCASYPWRYSDYPSLTGYDIVPDIVSDIVSDIKPDIVPGIIPAILCNILPDIWCDIPNLKGSATAMKLHPISRATSAWAYSTSADHLSFEN